MSNRPDIQLPDHSITGPKLSEESMYSFLNSDLVIRRYKADTKSTPSNPRVYIYRYYNIDPKEGLKYVRKYTTLRR